MDAAGQLGPEDHELQRKGLLTDLLYADDMLLLGVSAASLGRFLAAISVEGAKYGLEIRKATGARITK